MVKYFNAEMNGPDGKLIGRIPVMMIALSTWTCFYIQGLDADKWGGLTEIEPVPDQKATHIGKLNTLDQYLRKSLQGIMKENLWNFEMSPNPEVIFIERP